MNTLFNRYYSSPLPIKGHSFIAPYWSDVDLTGIGEVYYRQTTSPVLLAKANKEIKTAYTNHQYIYITNLFIVTWNTDGYYSRGTDQVS